jgi:hypothetical protein
MNCKPGDLAVIIHCPPAPDCVGRIVQCLRFEGNYIIDGLRYPDVWRVDWSGKSAREITGCEAWGMRDAWMRPLRDPGDDARDETLEWLPSPAQLEAMS